MADETLSLSDDDEGVKIRPPQHRTNFRHGDRASRDGRRDRREEPRVRREGLGVDRPRSRDERRPLQSRRQVDPRDRRRREDEGRHRGQRDPREDRDHHRRRRADIRPSDKSEERRRKDLASESEEARRRRDLELRTRRNQVDRERMDYEERLKRQRDRSAEGVRTKRTRDEMPENKELVKNPRDKNESSGNETNEEVDDDTEEENSGTSSDESDTSSDESGTSSEQSDTASEQSGATPDHITDNEEEELEVEREVDLKGGEEESEEESPTRSRKKKHRKISPPTVDDEDTEGRWRDRSLSEGSAESSPKEEAMDGDQDQEDEEDSRLEAALRGELKERLLEVVEGTPKSQSSSVGMCVEMDEASRDASKAVINAEEEENRLPPYLPSIFGCRSVSEYHTLNRIEEGTYGVVYRARDKKSLEIVALKRLKMEFEKEGFPRSSLREINTILISQHINVVTVREIVVGSNMDQIFIVMDFVEHDLKTLMESMRQKKKSFSIGEIKCLMNQLLKAIAHLHENWIIHRDLKTSNLLLGHDGTLKVGDFGLAREYGSPLKEYTQLVVTLWYRAPELLLGQREYSTHIDVWSIGCIFAELLQMQPLFCGTSEQDQLSKMFKVLGTPTEEIWPGYESLPLTKQIKFPSHPKNNLRRQIPFPNKEFTAEGLSLLQSFLAYDPKKRATCSDCIRVSERTGRQETVGLAREYFGQEPRIIAKGSFSSWPAKSEISDADRASGVRKAPPSPKLALDKKTSNDDDDDYCLPSSGGGFDFAARNAVSALPGWQLKY